MTALADLRTGAKWQQFDPKARHLYTYLAALDGYQYRLGDLELVHDEAATTIAGFYQICQAPNGLWADERTVLGMETPGTQTLVVERWKAWNAQLAKQKQPLVDKPRAQRYTLDGQVPYSVVAMQYLARATWPAVAAHWQVDGMTERSAALPVALALVNRRGSQLSYVRTGEWPPPYIPDLPSLVVLCGKGELSATQSAGLRPIIPYLRNRGLLVVEAPADADGILLAKSVFSALGADIPGATFGEAPADSLLLALLPEPMPLRAITDETGRIVVLFIMIGEEAKGYSLTPPKAAAVLESVLMAKLPPLLLDPRFPVLDANGQPFAPPAPEVPAEPAEGTEE
jgi:hypothetical protein